MSLPFLVAIFAGSALAIAFASVRLAHLADALADRTGMAILGLHGLSVVVLFAG